MKTTYYKKIVNSLLLCLFILFIINDTVSAIECASTDVISTYISQRGTNPSQIGFMKTMPKVEVSQSIGGQITPIKPAQVDMLTTTAETIHPAPKTLRDIRKRTIAGQGKLPSEFIGFKAITYLDPVSGEMRAVIFPSGQTNKARANLVSTLWGALRRIGYVFSKKQVEDIIPKEWGKEPRTGKDADDMFYFLNKDGSMTDNNGTTINYRHLRNILTSKSQQDPTKSGFQFFQEHFRIEEVHHKHVFAFYLWESARAIKRGLIPNSNRLQPLVDSIKEHPSYKAFKDKFHPEKFEDEGKENAFILEQIIRPLFERISFRIMRGEPSRTINENLELEGFTWEKFYSKILLYYVEGYQMQVIKGKGKGKDTGTYEIVAVQNDSSITDAKNSTQGDNQVFKDGEQESNTFLNSRKVFHEFILRVLGFVK